MAWMNRKALVSVLVLGAAAGVWSCTSTDPMISDPNAMSGGSGGTGTATGGTTASGGGKSCIPGFDCPGSGGTSGSSTAGAAGSGVVAGSGPSAGGTAGGSPPGVGGVPPTTGGTAGAGGTAGIGSGATAGAGGDTMATGGTGGTSVGGTLGSIQVSAGTLARDHSVVTFDFPAGIDKKDLILKDSAGSQIPLQVDAQGKATFVLSSLAAGATATYTVEQLGAASPDGIGPAMAADMQLHMKQGETERFRWMLVPDNFANRPANDVRAGYIYPLYTPAGVQVAGDYGPDHPHMHGIWSAWTLTTFRGNKVDFWNGYDNSGHVDLEQVTGVWSGPVHAGLSANIKHEAIKYTPWVKVMHETWVVTIYKTHEDAATPYYMFDIDSVQTVITPEPLILEPYHYGGFGYRGNIEWDAAKSSILTSEGLTRANGADGSRAKWCAQFGPIGGKIGGFAGMSHPTNFRHPQGLRVHPTNPFWSFTPVTESGGGRATLEPNAPLVSKYRVVVFDGNADAALLNRIWDDFATPPTVTVLP